eukprot:CAMPEP_0181346412 /NCGR_PEP_ID=MMETSP1101-20121128/33313_1 /TAXON_ID=46948 /ORGANISM="Rhodomonas abbreviata, Strain Caron Lab Isolate" /LENGTH=309 /DNA_ID=CAMNT_0023458521 /DNA_START=203 /DNA_END=1129 /DNA_ORIENTATION=+
MRQHGTDTLGELQAELAEGRRVPDSWITLLLRDMHGIGMTLTSKLDSEPGIPSLCDLTRGRRQELEEDIKSLVNGDRHRKDAVIQATVEKLRQERADIWGILGIYGGGISHEWIKSWETGAEISPESDGKVNKEARKQLYDGGQRPITDYFQREVGVAPLPRSDQPRSKLARWLDGPGQESTQEAELDVRGDRDDIPLPYWDDRLAYERLITVVGLSADGKMAKCRFKQTIPDGEKRVDDKRLQDVAEAMVRNRATITVEDKSNWSCWADEEGFLKLRVDGYKRFKINRRKRFCFTGTIIGATDKEELG